LHLNTQAKFENMKLESRVKFYVQNVRYDKSRFHSYLGIGNVGIVNSSLLSYETFLDYNLNIGSIIFPCFQNNHFYSIYLKPVAIMMRDLGIHQDIPVLIGDSGIEDISFSLPIIAKSRPINNKNIALLNLNKRKHWTGHYTFAKDDLLDTLSKKPICIWRGTTTGDWFDGSSENFRYVLFRKFFSNNSDLLDFGLSSVTSSTRIRLSKEISDQMKKWVKGEMSTQDLLTYRYILSLEGNDISTSLKWILRSNSVPLLPTPKFDSWIMESTLIPYEHYIPVENDFSNLDSLIDQCNSNPRLVSHVADAGKAYIKNFENDEEERLISHDILKYFLSL